MGGLAALAIFLGNMGDPISDEQAGICTDALALLKEETVVRCEDCKHSNFYCTEDADGEWLFECCHPSTGDNSVIHKWNWFCADGERG